MAGHIYAYYEFSDRVEFEYKEGDNHVYNLLYTKYTDPVQTREILKQVRKTLKIITQA